MQDIRCPCCNRLLMRLQGNDARGQIRCERARCKALVGITAQGQEIKITVLEYGRIKTLFQQSNERRECQ